MPFLILRALTRSASRGNDLVTDVADKHRHADSHASLAGRAVTRADKRIDRLQEIGLRHDYHVVLGAAQRMDTFAVKRTLLVDIVGDGCGSNEADS